MPGMPCPQGIVYEPDAPSCSAQESMSSVSVGNKRFAEFGGTRLEQFMRSCLERLSGDDFAALKRFWRCIVLPEPDITTTTWSVSRKRLVSSESVVVGRARAQTFRSAQAHCFAMQD